MSVIYTFQPTHDACNHCNYQQYTIIEEVLVLQQMEAGSLMQQRVTKVIFFESHLLFLVKILYCTLPTACNIAWLPQAILSKLHEKPIYSKLCLLLHIAKGRGVCGAQKSQSAPVGWA